MRYHAMDKQVCCFELSSSPYALHEARNDVSTHCYMSLVKILCIIVDKRLKICRVEFACSFLMEHRLHYSGDENKYFWNCLFVENNNKG